LGFRSQSFQKGEAGGNTVLEEGKRESRKWGAPRRERKGENAT